MRSKVTIYSRQVSEVALPRHHTGMGQPVPSPLNVCRLAKDKSVFLAIDPASTAPEFDALLTVHPARVLAEYK